MRYVHKWMNSNDMIVEIRIVNDRQTVVKIGWSRKKEQQAKIRIAAKEKKKSQTKRKTKRLFWMFHEWMIRSNPDRLKSNVITSILAKKLWKRLGEREMKEGVVIKRPIRFTKSKVSETEIRLWSTPLFWIHIPQSTMIYELSQSITTDTYGRWSLLFISSDLFINLLIHLIRFSNLFEGLKWVCVCFRCSSGNED